MVAALFYQFAYQVPLCAFALFFAPFSFWAIRRWTYKNQLIRNILYIASTCNFLVAILWTIRLFLIAQGSYHQVSFWTVHIAKIWFKYQSSYFLIAVFGVFVGIINFNISLTQFSEWKIFVICALFTTFSMSQLLYSLRYLSVTQEDGAIYVDYNLSNEVQDPYVTFLDIFKLVFSLFQVIALGLAHYYSKRFCENDTLPLNDVRVSTAKIINRLAPIFAIFLVPAAVMNIILSVSGFYGYEGEIIPIVRSIFIVFADMCVVLAPLIVKWAIQPPVRTPNPPAVGASGRNLALIHRRDPAGVIPPHSSAAHVTITIDAPLEASTAAVSVPAPIQEGTAIIESQATGSSSEYSGVKSSEWNTFNFPAISDDTGAINEGMFDRFEGMVAAPFIHAFGFVDEQDSGFEEEPFEMVALAHQTAAAANVAAASVAAARVAAASSSAAASAGASAPVTNGSTALPLRPVWRDVERGVYDLNVSRSTSQNPTIVMTAPRNATLTRCLFPDNDNFFPASLL